MFEGLAKRYLAYSRASGVLGLLLIGASVVVYGLRPAAAYAPLVPEPLFVAGVLYVIGSGIGYLSRIRGVPLFQTTVVLVLTFLWGAGVVVIVYGLQVL